jgi:hypothetical protein
VCVSVRACVWCDGVGSAVLVGMCLRWALGLRKSEASSLCHTRDVEGACWACIAGFISSAATRELYRIIAIADLCCRVCFAAPHLAVAGV